MLNSAPHAYTPALCTHIAIPTHLRLLQIIALLQLLPQPRAHKLRRQRDLAAPRLVHGCRVGHRPVCTAIGQRAGALAARAAAQANKCSATQPAACAAEHAAAPTVAGAGHVARQARRQAGRAAASATPSAAAAPAAASSMVVHVLLPAGSAAPLPG